MTVTVTNCCYDSYAAVSQKPINRKSATIYIKYQIIKKIIQPCKNYLFIPTTNFKIKNFIFSLMIFGGPKTDDIKSYHRMAAIP
jgi:hypothetical protein